MCVGPETRREILRRKESEGNGGKDRVIGSIRRECKGKKLSKGREPVMGCREKGSVRTEYIETCVNIHDLDYYFVC